ncbi:hypothetical protein JAAARDRAFT_196325 [Jaapia argillacea MUCL 33604]|uniref:Uncharacterized protein n=1 Tax=Jaapia argillacea MUCL 33604 TaxID=933084 RepID=A0A067PJ96_9AGAM|nr:hypothetical protein JAAARDRAFT_196325 [Jaapia argillacea MUCL 33604]
MSKLSDDQTQDLFRKLKVSCVPLLANSLLTPSSIPQVSKLLSSLLETLQQCTNSSHVLTPSLVGYTFFPISTLLRRNPTSSIPDQVFEKIFRVLRFLCDTWWWDCDLKTWEQMVTLSGAILGGIDESQNGRKRDDETKDAAASCLLALLRVRTPDEDPSGSGGREQAAKDRASARLTQLQSTTKSPRFIPIVGQTIDSLLQTAYSHHLPLQRISLELLHLLVAFYLADGFIPSVLPGVVSTTSRIILGADAGTRSSREAGKGWANGDVVAASLKVIQEIIVKAIGDDICIREGAIRNITELQDLADLASDSSSPLDEKSTQETKPSPPYSTPRTPVWLKATSTQVHIALNALTPVLSHPTPSALRALATFSSRILSSTSLTLPQSQPLLLSFLLSLSNSNFPKVSGVAQKELAELLDRDMRERGGELAGILMQMTRDNLVSLPRLLPMKSDAKVEHVASLVEAICRLSTTASIPPSTSAPTGAKSEAIPALSSISSGIARLLGPTGGIEKWGWSLLSVLEFLPPSILVSPSRPGHLLLLESTSSQRDTNAPPPFPELTLKNVSTRSTLQALERMFRALGSAGGEECLFSVEWFVSVGAGRSEGAGRGSKSGVAALWCACRILEGVSGQVLVDINMEARDYAGSGQRADVLRGKSRRLTKLARNLARSVVEMWEEGAQDDLEDPITTNYDSQQAATTQELSIADENTSFEYRQGLRPVRLTISQHPSVPSASSQNQSGGSSAQHTLHQSLRLQLLSISSLILQSSFTPLLLHTLYPILSTLLSSSPHLSLTAYSTLLTVASSTSHATPSNLLMSNFDYALDGISRRLSNRRLGVDVDAAKVLGLVVHLVGRDVIVKGRAGDLVEEVFDRLDEFHGYEGVVEALVEVLGEVVKVIEGEEQDTPQREEDVRFSQAMPKDSERFDALCGWFKTRHEPGIEGEEDYGPAPREAWGGDKGKGTAEESEGDEQQKPAQEPNPSVDPPPTPAQTLTKQIVSRSLYFLTHGMPTIRARILTLLSSSVPVLPESALLPSIHHAWPFILNRLSDPEPYVVSAAAALIESLATHVGSFMGQRIWDDVWPRFRGLLKKLDIADSKSALSRRGPGAVGTESAYTHSHRLYRSSLKTMTAAMKGVHIQDSSAWDVTLAFRRFLQKHAHEELQVCARELYLVIGKNNEDAVWLALSGTMGTMHEEGIAFLREDKWDLSQNASIIFSQMSDV